MIGLLVTRKLQIGAILVVLAIYTLFSLPRLGYGGIGQDEGAFGISALNILQDYHQLARVAETPLGPAATKPFLYPAGLALSILLFGKTTFALKMTNVLALAAASLLLRSFLFNFTSDWNLSFLTFSFFLLNPGTLDYARLVTAEPFVLLWGCFGLWAAAKYIASKHPLWAVLCGAALGLGFISKLWLVGSFGLACVALLTTAFWKNETRQWIVGCALLGVAFIVVAASHLLIVAWLTPSDMPHWLEMYFGTSFSTRLSGSKYDPDMWFRSWWFYGAAFFKATWYAFPFALLAIRPLAKRENRRLAILGVCLLFPVAALSVFRVKEAIYMFPAYPGMALLIAVGLLHYLQRPPSRQVSLASIISVLVAGFMYKVDVLSASQLFLIAGTYALVAVFTIFAEQGRRIALCLAVGLLITALLFTDVMAVRRAIRDRSYYYEVAAFFQQRLAANRPEQVSFIGPEHAAIGFWLFRTGQYWRTFYVYKQPSELLQQMQQGGIAFLVVDPSGRLYGGSPSPEQFAVVQQYATDVTAQVEGNLGHLVPFRVYVPEQLAQR